MSVSTATPGEQAPPPTTTVGGLPIAILDRDQTADLMIAVARQTPRKSRPYYMTSANGEVLARINTDPQIRSLFLQSDTIAADGQSLIVASRLFCQRPLPMRVATTDLFHDVAKRAEREDVTFYMLGATPAEIETAASAVRKRYPRLRLLGSCHGYLKGAALDAKLAEIRALRPDILWLAMGVPLEQQFVHEHGHKLEGVGIIKTSGGLFNFLSGSARRAPQWLQNVGLEWLWRTMMEPRRLFWRYLVTNPVAMIMMFRHSK